MMQQWSIVAFVQSVATAVVALWIRLPAQPTVLLGATPSLRRVAHTHLLIASQSVVIKAGSSSDRNQHRMQTVRRAQQEISALAALL